MRCRIALLGLLALLAGLPAASALAQDEEFVFGLVLIGPETDHGWSQAHYEGGRYVEEHIPGTRMVFFPSLNPADAPGETLHSVVADMVDQGARLIFTTSDAFEVDTLAVAEAFPDVIFMNISGDDALTGEAPPNEGNLMGAMEWTKLIAGCAAGLTTETGNIAYVGPLINFETRRLAASAFLGARHCYAFKGGNPDELTFSVTWIGFWFHIPGVTLDPTVVTNEFIDGGADVVISGIDTTEVIEVAAQRAASGETVFAIPYDYEGACVIGPEVCLGVPYFRWGPEYARIVQSVMDGTWQQSWDWVGPDWSDLNNPETSSVGWVMGDGLTDENRALLEDFIDELAEYATNIMTPRNEFGIKSIALWVGPLNLQDGTELAAPGQPVDALDVWYLRQLLDGMTGLSEAE